MNIFANDETSFISIAMDQMFQVRARLVSDTDSVLVEYSSLFDLVSAIAKHQTATILCPRGKMINVRPGYEKFNQKHLLIIGFGVGGGYRELIFSTVELLQQLSGESVKEYLENISMLSKFKEL